MRYVAAYLLAVLGGNNNPSAEDVKKVLGSVGIDADAACVKKVIDELKGKKIEEVMEAGRAKLASVPTGGAAASSGAAATAAAPAAEEKKEEKKESESEEEDEDMGFGLFD